MKKNSKLEIKEITSQKEIRRFIRFPSSLYKNDPYWVPPLNREERGEMSPAKNPAFEHCEAVYFLAYRNGTVTGRIAGIINHRYNKLWKRKLARFYWFDFVDDDEVSGSLLQAVERWAVSKGMDGMMGPMGFTTFERQGVLVEGFDRLPTIASTYNYAYYARHLEQHGYVKEHDYLEFRIRVPEELPAKTAMLEDMVSRRYHLHQISAASKKELMRYDRQVFRVVNEAYHDLLGFVPLTEKQITHFLKKFDSIIRPGFITGVVDEQDRLIGFQIAMPSLSQAFQKARGKLFPLGLFHIYKAIKRPKGIDLLLVGVIPEYQNKGVNAFFLNDITKACIAHGIRYGESNGMLEDNFKILNFSRYYEVEQHKRRRLFYKSL